MMVNFMPNRGVDPGNEVVLCRRFMPTIMPMVLGMYNQCKLRNFKVDRRFDVFSAVLEDKINVKTNNKK